MMQKNTNFLKLLVIVNIFTFDSRKKNVILPFDNYVFLWVK